MNKEKFLQSDRAGDYRATLHRLIDQGLSAKKLKWVLDEIIEREKDAEEECRAEHEMRCRAPYPKFQGATK